MGSSVKAKELLALVGKVQPQPASDWTGKISLPLALERFYEEVGPANVMIKLPGNPYLLPRLADLWKTQSGYRYGLREKPNEDWNENWFVVADAGGGDAMVFDDSTGKILHVYPGDEGWDSTPIFPDLNAMAASLALVGNLISKAGKNSDPYTDESRTLLTEKLGELLGQEGNPEVILNELGWD